MKVLIVDDEKACVETLNDFLSRCGHETNTAANGAEALCRMAKQRPEVVISDLTMPRMDGLELLDTIKKRFPDTLVILTSGHGCSEEKVGSRAGTAYAFLEKPFPLKKLVEIMTSLEEHLNQAPRVGRYLSNGGAV